jgi:hypothetical protein
MRVSPNFALHMAGVSLFALLLVAQPALAAPEGKPCPAEPTRNVRIVSPDVFAGANCIISPATDLDSFQFIGQKGHIYRIAVTLSDEVYPKNICLEFYTGVTKIFGGCSDSYWSVLAVVTDQTLTADGTHTIVVTESGGDSTIKYGLAIQRIYPIAPDARLIKLDIPLSDEINPPPDMDAFYFYGGVNSLYRITVTIPAGSYPANLCREVFGPDGKSVSGRTCTDSYWSVNSLNLDLAPPQNGNYQILLTAAGYSRKINYTLNVVCISPFCPPPPCTLIDRLSYDPAGNKLTMRFLISNVAESKWRTWLVYHDAIKLLWSVQRPVTRGPVEITRTASNLPGVGRAGVLSVLSTPTTGITCSTWAQVGTGAPENSSNLDVLMDLAISQLE